MEDLNVIQEKATVFKNLIGFRREISNPSTIKREIDLLLRRLGRANALHANKVITKVMDRNIERRTVDMQIMLPLKGTSGIDELIGENEYFYIDKYEISQSYRISIPNDPNQFKRAAEYFLQLSTGDGLDKFDAGRQHIIEVARIDLYGSTLGFDLYLEIAKPQEARC